MVQGMSTAPQLLRELLLTLFQISAEQKRGKVFIFSIFCLFPKKDSQ